MAPFNAETNVWAGGNGLAGPPGLTISAFSWWDILSGWRERSSLRASLPGFGASLAYDPPGRITTIATYAHISTRRRREKLAGYLK
jgi:hypothetical protein